MAFHIVVGTYETPLFGFLFRPNDPILSKIKSIDSDFQLEKTPIKSKIKEIEADDDKNQSNQILKKVFAYVPHSGAIKYIASSGPWLATTSTDESLKIYDLTTYKELGAITRANGPLTCLAFFQDSHLFCGTENGEILVWKSRDWTACPSLLGHTDRVNAFSIHPNGVMAVSLSKDKTLKLWDLTTGTVQHTNKLEQESQLVKWSPMGTSYFVITAQKLVVYNIRGKKISQCREEKKILTAIWVDETFLATGGESKVVSIWKMPTMERVRVIEGFNNRIKDLAVIQKETEDKRKSVKESGKETVNLEVSNCEASSAHQSIGQEDQSKEPINEPSNKYSNDRSRENPSAYIVTISSDEYIRIWDLDDPSNSVPLVSSLLDCRPISLTCTPMVSLKSFRSKKSTNKRRHIKISKGELTSESVSELKTSKKLKAMGFNNAGCAEKKAMATI